MKQTTATAHKPQTSHAPATKQAGISGKSGPAFIDRQQQVVNFINAIVTAAFFDASENISDRDSTRNSGTRLIDRLNLRRFRVAPRNGDAKYARSIYTAVRWLYDTEQV